MDMKAVTLQGPFFAGLSLPELRELQTVTALDAKHTLIVLCMFNPSCLLQWEGENSSVLIGCVFAGSYLVIHLSIATPAGN